LQLESPCSPRGHNPAGTLEEATHSIILCGLDNYGRFRSIQPSVPITGAKVRHSFADIKCAPSADVDNIAREFLESMPLPTAVILL
jgi:hypothetical protein